MIATGKDFLQGSIDQKNSSLKIGSKPPEGTEKKIDQSEKLQNFKSSISLIHEKKRKRQHQSVYHDSKINGFCIRYGNHNDAVITVGNECTQEQTN